MKKKNFDTICNILLRIKNRKQAGEFLKDFLTKREVDTVAERAEIVKMLLQGIPHRTISKKLKVSISKVTRGSHAVKVSRGGFKKLLK